MLCLHVFALAALKGCNNGIAGLACFRHSRFIQCRSHYVIFTVALNQRILKIRAKANRLVCGNCPGCGRPNDKVGMRKVSALCCQETLVICYTKFYVNGIAGILCVLNFSFRQCSFAVRAPVNRLKALVNQTFFAHIRKNFNLLCFIVMRQGNVWMGPIAKTTQTLKFIALTVNVGKREFTANFAQLYIRNRFTVSNTGLFAGFQLGRQAMRIPAGNIRRLKTGHVLGTDNHIFQNFVESGSQMDIAVCIRRAIMQDINRLALIFFHDLTVQVFCFPRRKSIRLPFGQMRLHREFSFWQIQSAFIIHRCSSLLQRSRCTQANFYEINVFC